MPVSTDPCGKVQYGIPNNSTEHQALGQGRLHDQLELVAVRALLLRGLRQPGDLRRQQRADAEPHRPEQPGAFDRVRPQPGAVGVDAQLAARDVQQDAERSAAAAVLQRHRPRRQGLQPGARLRRRSTSPATASRSATAAPIPGYFNSKSFQIADDVDLVRGNHQFSIGGNWIHSRIETLNNRPTNGAFTFNGQGTGLSLADFMLGIVSGGFIQGNPVYDYDHSEYVGAYAQDNWRVRPNVTVNLGLRWEPFLPVQNTYSWVSHFEQSRFDQNVHSTVYPQAPAGLMFPATPAIRASDDVRRRRWRSSRRASAWSGRRSGDERTSVRASWGVFYDTPHLFFNTRFANNPPWGAQITISEPARRLRRSVSRLSGRQPVPGAEHRLGDAAVPGVRRLRQHAARSRSRRRCSSGTSACSSSSATGWRARAISATTRATCGARPS